MLNLPPGGRSSPRIRLARSQASGLLKHRALRYDSRVGTVESYLELAARPDTVHSYAAAVRHFETE